MYIFRMPNSEILCVYLFIIFGDFAFYFLVWLYWFTDLSKISGRYGSHSVIKGPKCRPNVFLTVKSRFLSVFYIQLLFAYLSRSIFLT